jgi:hypothetical protein
MALKMCAWNLNALKLLKVTQFLDYFLVSHVPRRTQHFGIRFVCPQEERWGGTT